MVVEVSRRSQARMTRARVPKTVLNNHLDKNISICYNVIMTKDLHNTKRAPRGNSREGADNKPNYLRRRLFATVGALATATALTVGIHKINESSEYGNRHLDVPKESIEAYKLGDKTLEELGIGIYTVRSGDTLTSISKELYGESEDYRDFASAVADQYEALNPGKEFDATKIRPGDAIYFISPEKGDGK